MILPDFSHSRGGAGNGLVTGCGSNIDLGVPVVLTRHIGASCYGLPGASCPPPLPPNRNSRFPPLGRLEMPRCRATAPSPAKLINHPAEHGCDPPSNKQQVVPFSHARQPPSTGLQLPAVGSSPGSSGFKSWSICTEMGLGLDVDVHLDDCGRACHRTGPAPSVLSICYCPCGGCGCSKPATRPTICQRLWARWWTPPACASACASRDWRGVASSLAISFSPAAPPIGQRG